MTFVDSTRARIYYEAHGEGPAIVFAHGAGGNAATWFQQVPHFRDRYRVIVFEHRLFGRSECAPEDFGAAHFADDLRAILAAEDIERTALVCQSMGGWTGSRFTYESPERVSALVMSHTPGCFDNEALRMERDAAFLLVDQVASSQRQPGYWALAPDFPQTNPAMAYLYTQISGLNSRFDRDLLQGLTSAELMIDTAELDGYSTPTLFITASQDAIFPPHLMELVASAVPGAELARLGDAGHSSYFESPDMFNARVDAFLAQHWPAT